MVVKVVMTRQSKAYLAALRKNMEPKVFAKKLSGFLDRSAAVIAGKVSDEMLSGQRLKRRTGTLARSVIGFSFEFRGLPAMRIGVLRGPALAYAGVQEYGTKKYNPASPYPTIRPKHGKALAIPQKPALTPAGVDRFGGPRQTPLNLRFIPFRGTGVAVGGLFDPSTLPPPGSGLSLRSAKMYYLLVKYVDIKPTWYLRDGVNMSLPEFTNALADWLEAQWLGVQKLG